MLLFFTETESENTLLHIPSECKRLSREFSVLQVVEEYNRREQEIKHLEKELEDKTNALNAYRQNISEVDNLSLQ